MVSRLHYWLGFFLLAFCFAAHAQNTDAEISAQETYDLLQNGDITLIDIRRPEEWRQTGVAKGAKRINMLHPKGLQGFAQEVYNAVGGDLNAPIALICRTGSRTSRIQPILKQVGFTNVRHVPEGTLGNRQQKGWIDQGLPVEPCSDC
jgi:rhodanese-related sulfurtransferase